MGRLGVRDALVKELGVLIGSILGSFCFTALERQAVTLVLQTLGSNQTLDLGSLGVWLLALALGLDFTSNDELANIIFLAETEEAAKLRGPLGTQALGVYGIGDAGDFVVALLDNAESEDGEVHGDDASTDTLPLALACATGSVTGVALGEEKLDTGRMHDTLLHREALFVVATGDSEDVALELIADAVARNFVTHAAVHENAQLALIFNLYQLCVPLLG